MKRRTFLQALALSPIAPVLLCAKEKVLLESGLWMTREDYGHAGEPYDKHPVVSGRVFYEAKKFIDSQEMYVPFFCSSNTVYVVYDFNTNTQTCDSDKQKNFR